jgi:hypothetical protein
MTNPVVAEANIGNVMAAIWLKIYVERWVRYRHESERQARAAWYLQAVAMPSGERGRTALFPSSTPGAQAPVFDDQPSSPSK